MTTPVLHLLAGSNGAGKSTFAEAILIPRTHLQFVNAEAEHEALMTDRISFITETVFSHPSKLDLIQRAVDLGYTVWLHVVMVPEDLAVERVADRVAAGGHMVPQEKIRTRYGRLWALVARARDMADRAEFYDNSSLRAPFRRVAGYEFGQAVGPADWPSWAPAALWS